MAVLEGAAYDAVSRVVVAALKEWQHQPNREAYVAQLVGRASRRACETVAPLVAVNELERLLQVYRNMDRQSADDLLHLIEERIAELKDS